MNASRTAPRLIMAALTFSILCGCETFKIVDESLAGYIAGEGYAAPTAELMKALEETNKKLEEVAASAEESKAAEEAAKEKLAQLEHEKMKAEIQEALDALKAEKSKQEEIDAIIAKYEAEEKQPSSLNVQVYADEGANPNVEGDPAPVSVRLIALTSEHRLMGTDYFSLKDGLAGALGATFIKELGEISAEPGVFAALSDIEVPDATQTIGVIADFADVDQAIWRDSIAVDDKGEKITLFVALHDSTVRIMKEGDAPPPPASAAPPNSAARKQAKRAEPDNPAANDQPADAMTDDADSEDDAAQDGYFAEDRDQFPGGGAAAYPHLFQYADEGDAPLDSEGESADSDYEDIVFLRYAPPPMLRPYDDRTPIAAPAFDDPLVSDAAKHIDVAPRQRRADTPIRISLH